MNSRVIGLIVAAFLCLSHPARAQLFCPGSANALGQASAPITSLPYVVGPTDICLLKVFNSASPGIVKISSITPGSSFPVYFWNEGPGSITFQPQPNDSGNTVKINGQTTLTLVQGQGADFAVGPDGNWYANATAPGATLGANTFTGTQTAPAFFGTTGTFTTLLGNASGATALASNGTTPLTFAARYAVVYNILENGIVCNGTTNGVGTDNGAAFTALMTKAGAAASSAHRTAIYFPPQSGYCLTGTRLAPPSNVDLIAIQGTVVLAPKAGTTEPVALLMALVGSNNLIDGLTFEGGLGYSPVISITDRLVLVAAATNLEIRNSIFRHTRGVALEFAATTASTNVRITQNYFFDIGNYWKTTLQSSDRAAAILFDTPSTLAGTSFDIHIEQNHLSDIGLDPIDVWGNNVSIRNNTVYLTNGPLQWGNLTFPGAVNYPDSIDGSGNSYSVVGNTVVGSPGMCIAVLAFSLTITGNTCDSPGQAGIEASGSNLTISANAVRNAVQEAPITGQPTQNAGITLYGLTTDAVVSANTITDQHAQYGTVASGQATIKNLTNTAIFSAGNAVVSTFFAGGTTVLSVDSPSQITVSNNAGSSSTQASVTIGTPTMSYCYQGIGHTGPQASGDLVNVTIELGNQCSGYGSAVFEPATSFNVALQYGINYPSSPALLNVFPIASAVGAVTNSKFVSGTATLSGGSATITFSGNSVFTNSSSYFCAANDNSGSAAAASVQNQSGTQTKIFGTGTDVVNYLCWGT